MYKDAFPMSNQLQSWQYPFEDCTSFSKKQNWLIFFFGGGGGGRGGGGRGSDKKMLFACCFVLFFILRCSLPKAVMEIILECPGKAASPGTLAHL